MANCCRIDLEDFVHFADLLRNLLDRLVALLHEHLVVLQLRLQLRLSVPPLLLRLLLLQQPLPLIRVLARACTWWRTMMTSHLLIHLITVMNGSPSVHHGHI